MSLQLRSLQEVLEKTVFLPSLYLIALEPLPTNDTKSCDRSKDILGHFKNQFTDYSQISHHFFKQKEKVLASVFSRIIEIHPSICFRL